MRILVTGGAGFIGSNVIKVLEAKRIETFILDNFSKASYKNLLGLKGEVVVADILDEKIFSKLPKVDGVIHEAAITDTTAKDDAKILMVNFNGFKNVLNFCLAKKIKLVYASSAGVYGAGSSTMKESQKLVPLSTYAYSKYLCDCLAKKIINQKKSSLIVGLRYFNVYGPQEFHKGTAASMIYQLYLQMSNGHRPRIFKYGEQKRDFIYVKDAAEITVSALSLKKSAILNVGTARACSFNDIISILNKLLKKNLEPDYFDNPYQGKYQDYTRADTTLLEKVIGGKRFSLEEGIADYVRNYLTKINLEI